MRLGARRTVAGAAVATLTLVSVALIAWQRVAVDAVAPASTATLGGLTTTIRVAEWVELGHVHDGRGGFVMPDQMMPGAPRGDEVRLGVSVTLLNTHPATRGFNPAEEFSLTGGGQPQPRALSADTIGTLSRLAPGAAVQGTLYFDLEVPAEGDPPLYLQWTRDGETARIAVPLDPDPPGHDHG